MTGVMISMIGGGAALALSGDTINGASTVETTLEIRANGTVWSVVGAGETQLSPDTDWIRPVTNASGAYSVRFTQQSGDAFTVGTLGSWLSLDSDRAVGYSGSINSGVALVEISPDGGSTIVASAEYTIQITS